jgi:hypothetical protein
VSFDALLDFDESDLQDIGLAKGPRQDDEVRSEVSSVQPGPAADPQA